jgi:hypothetical protein
MMKDMVEVRS